MFARTVLAVTRLRYGTEDGLLNMTGRNYWLANWADEQGITSRRDLERPVSAASVQEALRLAEAATSAPAGPEHSSMSVVAGRQMDLSDVLACMAPKCLASQVDVLFAEVWHYFDKIVVEGLAPRRFLAQANSRSESDLVDRLKAHVGTILYAREIGAEGYLEFREKPHAFCSEHYRKHAEELGLPFPPSTTTWRWPWWNTSLRAVALSPTNGRTEQSATSFSIPTWRPGSLWSEGRMSLRPLLAIWRGRFTGDTP